MATILGKAYNRARRAAAAAGKNAYRAARAAEDKVWRRVAPRCANILEDNGKAGLAVALAFRSCARSCTRACCKECYAAARVARRPDIGVKAIANSKALEKAPVLFGLAVAAEFRKRAPRAGALFLRWNSQGDLTPKALRAIVTVARAGIVVHVFSRNVRCAAALWRFALRHGYPIIVLLSVDATSKAPVFAAAAAGARCAALTSAAYPAPFVALDSAATVAFPIDGRPDNITTVPTEFSAGACPCDMARRPFANSCATCLRDGMGCFMGM